MQKHNSHKNHQSEAGHFYDQLRNANPNSPEVYGTSTSHAAGPYENYKMQAGNELSTACKFEYNNGVNKATLPGLAVKTAFDLVPSVEECGGPDSVNNQNVLLSGFDMIINGINVSPRNECENLYGLTADEENFYYCLIGQSRFRLSAGFGASTVFVARRKCNSSLVWIRSVYNFTLEPKGETNIIGSISRNARVCLAVYKDHLFSTSEYANAGPQLFCINKLTGSPVWTMAYAPPVQVNGGNPLVAPFDLAFGSLNVAQENKGRTYANGNINITVKEITDGRPSIFLGTSTFQNFLNFDGLFNFPVFVDQGKFFRIDEVSGKPEIQWTYNACAKDLKPGDVISNNGPDHLNPFRPGSDEVKTWINVTANGLINDPANGKFANTLDYNGAQPGYNPIGRNEGKNNNTVPVVFTRFISAATPIFSPNDPTIPLIPSMLRILSPDNTEASKIIYQLDNPVAALNRPRNIISIRTLEELLQYWSDIRQDIINTDPTAFIKYTFWVYLTQDQLNLLDFIYAQNPLLGFLNNGQVYGDFQQQNRTFYLIDGPRVLTTLKSGHTIGTQQEADSLNHYGNSIWGQSPTLDLKRGLVYSHTGQSHNVPYDQILFYEVPDKEYYTLKQPIINGSIEYSEGVGGITVQELRQREQAFADRMLELSLNYNDRSPRDNMSYPDSIIALDIETGKLKFACRSLPTDAVTFLAGEENALVLQNNDPDGDFSSGVHLFDNLGGKTVLAAVAKSGLALRLDITSYHSNVEFTNNNLLETGIIPSLNYTGTDSFLGGTNYGSAQDGGRYLLFCNVNYPDRGGSVSFVTGQRERHITTTGKVLNVGEAYIAALDVLTGKLAWDTSLGDTAVSIPSCYNGVVYICSGGYGILYGINIENGQVIWKLDGQGNFGMAGTAAPIMDKGRFYWFSNYTSLGGFIPNGLGSTGIVLEVNDSLLIEPGESTKCITNGRKYTSYDVNPKIYNVPPAGEDIFSQSDLFINDDTVTHKWCSNSISCKHQILYPSYETGTISEKTVEFYVRVNNPVNNIITFEPFSNPDVRYLNIRLLNRKSYLLNYQLFKDGKWVNREATLDVRQNRDHHQYTKNLLTYKKENLKEEKQAKHQLQNFSINYNMPKK